MCKAEEATQAAPVPSHMWRIHGKDYDLSSFVSVHPGGPISVALGRGSDCSKLFESYHVMSERHRHVLQRYAAANKLMRAVAEDSAEEKSAFHADVKALVRMHFRGRGARAHKAKFTHCAAMCLVFAAYVRAWLGWYHGSYLGLFALPLLAWLVMVNLAHDGSHFAVSQHPWVNQLCVYSSTPLFYTDATWYMQHIVSHHLETNNLQGDVDLHHHSAARWHPRAHRAKGMKGCRNLCWHTTAFLASTFVLAAVQPMTKFVVPGLCLLLGAPVPHLWGSSPVFNRVLDERLAAGFATVPRLMANVLLWAWAAAVPLLPLWAYGPSLKALLFGLYPFVVSSFIFMTVTQVSHVQRETQSQAALKETDFFKTQAMTSLDYSSGSSLWSFLMGGLNTQSLHHVTPSVHSSHYPDLYPKFYQLALRHGCAPPQAPHIGSAFLKHLQYVYDLGEGYTLPSPEM